MKYKPDFLMKPYEVHECDGLRPSDSDVYAVIYWFEKMRGEKCIASNQTIAEVARVSVRSVMMSLDRLEKYNFIERIYDDAEKNMRSEIRTLIHMNRVPTDQAPEKPKKEKRKKASSEIAKVDAVQDEMTPGQMARDFFLKESVHRDSILNEICERSGVSMDRIMAEARKFFVYWTEPTKSGKMQLWETKPTFEVKRRLYTWLSKSNNFNPKKNGSGAGATI